MQCLVTIACILSAALSLVQLNCLPEVLAHKFLQRYAFCEVWVCEVVALIRNETFRDHNETLHDDDETFRDENETKTRNVTTLRNALCLVSSVAFRFIRSTCREVAMKTKRDKTVSFSFYHPFSILSRRVSFDTNTTSHQPPVLCSRLFSLR